MHFIASYRITNVCTYIYVCVCLYVYVCGVCLFSKIYPVKLLQENLLIKPNFWNVYAGELNQMPKRKSLYRKTSGISHTKSQNLNVSCIVWQLFSIYPLKPGVKLRMKMQLEQRRQAMLELHLSYQQFYLLPIKVRLILEVLR